MAGEDEKQFQRLELLEVLTVHLGAGALQLGEDGAVVLRTRLIDRLEGILGEGWYRPCIASSSALCERALTDGSQRIYRFQVSSLSLFSSDDVRLFRWLEGEKWAEPDAMAGEVASRSFLNHLPAAVVIRDDWGRILYANQYVRENFGDLELPGADTDGPLSPKLPGRSPRARLGHRDEAREDLIERLKDRHGRARTFRTLRFLLPPSDRAPPLSGYLGWDLSDALAASESLAQGRRRYQEIFEIAQEGIWLLDADADTLEVNRRMANMPGYGVEEMRGCCLFDFVDEQAKADAGALLEGGRRGLTEKHDLQFRTKSGMGLWTIVTSAPRYDEKGAHSGVLMMVTDITSRKWAEAALKRERDFAEGLIQTAPVIVLVLDPQGRIIRFNSFTEKLAGYLLKEIAGQSWFDIFVAERDILHVVKAFGRARDGIQAQGSTNTILTRDGRERLIDWYVTTLKDAAGGLGTVLAIGHDVTEQRAKEAQLVQAQRMETVGQLTRGIAHDFNNLLTIILGNLELLKTSLSADADRDLYDLAQDSYSAAEDGAELTKRLLAFSRKASLKQERVEMSEFLARFQRFLQRTLGPSVCISTQVAADLNDLFCDPHQLENALLNLALNAREAMPDGGRIHIQARSGGAAELDPILEPGRYVEIAVVDTGAGMDAEQLAHAIEPFYTTKGTGQGTGLGLSMVFGFCERAGGIFRLASKPGAGTKATIVLPLGDGKGESREGAVDSSTGALGGNGKVLVVEDDERVCKLDGRYLAELGYDPVTAESGERALELLASEDGIELVFSDLVMPGAIDGDDLYLWVKAQRPQIKVLLTTGLRAEEIARRAADRGPGAPIGLPKPYTKEQLAEAIRIL